MRAMESCCRDLEREILDLRRASVLAEDEKKKTVLLLKTRTAELQEAQVYLNKIDDIPDSEVVRCVTDLNSAIFQTAAALVDAFHGYCGRNQNVKIIEEASERLTCLCLLTPRLLEIIRVFDHTGDSILLQTALQALLAVYLRWLCNTWDFHPRGGPCKLKRLYSSIQKNGTYS